VLAADSDQPVADVKVIRGNSQISSHTPKGAELLMRRSPAQTDREGRFVIPSERVLTLVRGAGWNQLPLTFEAAGYDRLRTNFSLSQATNSPAGEPVLETGDIRLSPARKAPR
jgi:hypothetical protein